MLFGLAPAAIADELAPDALIRQITAEVLDAIKHDPELRSGDRRKSLALAEDKVLPYIDFRYAMQTAVGPPWASASSDQQEKLTAEFRSMLIRVYSLAIGVYRGQTMEVLPVRMAAGATEANVRAQYRGSDGRRIAIEYAVHKVQSGWKVFDITVEGVSLVLAYRSDFSQVLRQSGVDGLIKAMADKNRVALGSGTTG